MPAWFRLLRRKKDRQELDEEIESHLAMDVQQRVERGESRDQARANARKAFGNVDLVKEVTRDSWKLFALERPLEDLCFAARMFRRYSSFSVMVVLIVALTVGVNAAIFSVTNTVLIRPLPYGDPDRLVTFDLPNRETREVVSGVAGGLLEDLQESGIFDSVAMTLFTGKNWSGAGEPEELEGLLVSPSFFEVLGITPHLGRFFGPNEGRPGAEHVVIFTHEFWRRRYGNDRSVIGKTIMLDREPFALVGILPQGFIFPDGSPGDFYLPYPLSPADSSFHNGGPNLAFARLRSSLTTDQAQIRLNDLAKRLESRYPETNAGLGIQLVGLKDRLLGEAPGESIVFLQIGVFLVLLIGCANLANLFVARSTSRRREMLIRTALGAGRGRLIQQMMIEGALFAVVGGALGLLFAAWMVSSFPLLIPGVPRIQQIDIDRNVVAFTLVITALSAVIFSLVPAVRISGRSLHTALNHSGSTSVIGWKRPRGGGLLLSAEVAMTLMLLILAGLTMNSMFRLYNVDPGFNTANILTMQIRPVSGSRDPKAMTAFYAEAVRRLQQMPGVRSAAAVSHIPMAGTLGARMPITRGGVSETARVRMITPDYFQTLAIPILKGSGFADANLRNVANVAIINETMARRFWGAEEPLNSSIATNMFPRTPMEFTVVGIAKDVLNSPYSRPQPEVYVPLLQVPTSYPSVFFVLKSEGSPQGMVDAVRTQIWQIDKYQPITDIATYDAIIHRYNGYEYFLTLLQTSFALLGIGLAGFGIYGVLSYAVSQRTREIGVRMALGAQPHEVLSLIIREAAPAVIGGVIAGLAFALALATYARSSIPFFLFQIEATDALTYLTVILLLLVIAILASWLPARRATGVDPAAVLRHE